MTLPKLKNLFFSETLLRFCAIDLQISFLAFAIASKKKSITVSETQAKWLQFSAVSETRDLATFCLPTTLSTSFTSPFLETFTATKV